MNSNRSRTRSGLTLVLTVVVVLALMTIPGWAGNGNGRGPGGERTAAPTATLVADCDPCVAGDVVSFSGTGYDASQGTATLDVAGAYTSTAVYSDGSVAFDWPYFSYPGEYTVDVYQHRNKKHLELKATLTVVVGPTG